MWWRHGCSLVCAHPGRSHLCVADSPLQDRPEFKHLGFSSKILWASKTGAVTFNLAPPTLHDLEWAPKWTRMGPPKDWTQPFTIRRVLLSRKLTADFLLPNSAHKIRHLHQAVGRSRSCSHFASSREGVAPPPTLHNLERLPNGQG